MTSIAEKTLTADDIATAYAAAGTPPPPSAKPAKPTAPKLPEQLEVENYSQARRMCLNMFGPLVRLYERDFPEGKLYEIAMPGEVIAAAESWKAAVQMAMEVVFENEQEKTPTAGLMPARTRNLTVERRMRLANVLPSAYQGDEQMTALLGVLGLQDHQLFEAQKLLTATTEGKMELREVAAKDLKDLLADGAQRFQRMSQKAAKAK